MFDREFQTSQFAMIRAFKGLGCEDTLRIPIIENYTKEDLLCAPLQAAILAYVNLPAVLC